jgi:hypothetical protein
MSASLEGDQGTEAPDPVNSADVSFGGSAFGRFGRARAAWGAPVWSGRAVLARVARGDPRP